MPAKKKDDAESPDDLIPTKDVAAYFGVPRERIQRYAREGSVPATKEDKHLAPWMIKRSDFPLVEAAIADHAANTGGPRNRGGLRPGGMTDEHKEAIRRGRDENAAVEAYLTMLLTRPKRGRPRSRERLEHRLNGTNLQLAPDYEGDDHRPLTARKRLELIQQKLDLETSLAELDALGSEDEIEAAFVEVAAAYGNRKGISYGAWRHFGVHPNVLKRAGITVTRTMTQPPEPAE
jgi:hypothetical protein